MSGRPVNLALLFEEGYKTFYNTDDCKATRLDILKGKKKVSKQPQIKKRSDELSSNLPPVKVADPTGNVYNDYRNYLDQFKAYNPKYTSISTYVMRGIADRVKRYYNKYKSIPQSALHVWGLPNMPFIILAKNRVKLDTPVIRVHGSDVNRSKLDFELNRGNTVRISEMPVDFDLSGYEVYGDGSIENDAILGNYAEVNLSARSDILSNSFAKRGKSEFATAGPQLDWLAELENAVLGDSIDLTISRKIEPQVASISIWYTVVALFTDPETKVNRTYRGILLSPKPIGKVPVSVPNDEKHLFLYNFITSEHLMVDLPLKSTFGITILERTITSAGMKGFAAYRASTITTEPGVLYYLVGRKGSGKSQKLKLLSTIGNVEDSDDYGVWLSTYLRNTGMLNKPVHEIMTWTPDPSEVTNSIMSFISRSHDYEDEESIFLVISRTVYESKLSSPKKRSRLIQYVNQIMSHPYIGMGFYSNIRLREHDDSKPTFVMVHSTAETGFRTTPTDIFALSEVINSMKNVMSRDRSGTGMNDQAELLLYYAYAEGISTVNKVLPFAIILEQLRRYMGDTSFGALKLDEWASA